jgi:ubiquinone/menaquinone biosynthesis C-methylase UbiE
MASTTFLARGADKYDAYMGRWSRRLAGPFLDFAGIEAGERIIEIGCGTGSLTFALPGRAEIARVEAIDYTQAFVDTARERNRDPRINIRQGDAQSIPFADGSFDRALSMLVFHFVADPDRAVAEMRRVLRPGGVAAATVWDNFGGQTANRLFWDTLAAIEPGAGKRRDNALIRPTTQPGELAGAFERAGFADVTETTLTVRMDFESFDDYWIPMTTGQGAQADAMASLSGATRQRFEDSVRAGYLCGRADGTRSFASLAWAARGTVPRA